MYANRYPITLRLALREIWIVSSGIWSQYRADARLRSARRRDARIRARTYRHPGEELDRSLWFVAIVLILGLVGLTCFEGWTWIDAWLSGAGAAKAIGATVAIRPSRLTPESMALLRHLVRHPGSTMPELAAKHPDQTARVLRRRLDALTDAGYVDRKRGGKLGGEGGRSFYTWSVVRWPEEQEAPQAPVVEAPRPIVPPRRPDNAQPWVQPYLTAVGRRPGADDFRAAPTLHAGQRHAYQPKP